MVSTVRATSSTPILTPSVYPSNWTTTGSVTKPSVTSSLITYGDGYSFTQNGAQATSFWQSVLSSRSISDPNAWVYSSTTLYNLNWGTPDQNGPAYSALFFDGAASSVIFSSTLNYWGKVVSGQCPAGPILGFCLNGPTIGTPHTEVLSAWQQGWTGKGVNIMVEDFLSEVHGTVTALLASRYAIGSSMYGVDIPTGLGVYNLDKTVAHPASIVNIGVVNASYGANLPVLIGHSGPWSALELSNAATAYAPYALAVVNRYTGTNSWTNFNYTDAVITKAAGNDGLSGLTANKEPLVKALASNASINSRLLVVGALTMAGFTATPATISNYSNKAGTDPTVQSRFLVASGTTPFSTGDIAINGIPVDATTSIDPNGVSLGNVGTSYAAPRVAGYVAIVRSKFPNLDAIKTSSIMLDTARYDTLTCYTALGGCDPTIYGKGEASLSRALAPVGRLR